MKKIIIVAGLFLMIGSCKEKSNGVFTVAGTIKNAPSNKVYLKELPFGGANPIVVDSATLQNGKFELNTNTLEGRKFINDYYKFFELEKEQIEKSFSYGYKYGYEYDLSRNGVRYYKETFKLEL